MRFLRIIWKDILWLNSRLAPAMKIAGLILVIAVILLAWYQGAEYWAERVGTKYRSRPQRGGIVAVGLGILFLCYIGSVLDRYRKSR